MREIKFRAWDTITNSYTKNSIDMSHCNDGTFYPFGGNRYIIEQFTGLRDKNGREIYEGDILKMDNQPHETGVIEFSGNGYWIKDEFANYIPSESMCEVIGNIHENQELLP